MTPEYEGSPDVGPAVYASTENRPTTWSGDLLRWLVGVVLAAVVAYFTTISTLNQGLAEVRERQKNQFEEVLRRLDLLQTDVRELRMHARQ